MLEFTSKFNQARRAYKVKQTKNGVFSLVYEGQAVKIGKMLIEINRLKNYIGQAVDDYFQSKEWHDFYTETLKPTSSAFEGKLCYEEEKKTKDYRYNPCIDKDALSSLIREDCIQIGPLIDNALENEVIITPDLIVGKEVQSSVKHDFEDIVRKRPK